MIFDELDDRGLKVICEGSGAGIFGIQPVKYASERLTAAQRQSGGFPMGIRRESGGTHFAICLKRIGVNKSGGNPMGIRWESCENPVEIRWESDGSGNPAGSQ